MMGLSRFIASLDKDPSRFITRRAMGAGGGGGSSVFFRAGLHSGNRLGGRGL
jgi:hypothetical protein